MSTQFDQPQQKMPQWLWLLLGGVGSLLLVAAAVAWIVRGSAILFDMQDFFCF